MVSANHAWSNQPLEELCNYSKMEVTCLKKLLIVSVTGLKFVKSGTTSYSAISVRFIDLRDSYTELRLDRTDNVCVSVILDCCHKK